MSNKEELFQLNKYLHSKLIILRCPITISLALEDNAFAIQIITIFSTPAHTIAFSRSNLKYCEIF